MKVLSSLCPELTVVIVIDTTPVETACVLSPE